MTSAEGTRAMGPEAKTLGTSDDRPASFANPRSPKRSAKGNFEMWAWLFMRFSGLALVFLVIGHLVIMLILDDGVHRINFAFVAGRWANPFWQMWDLSMLWLAQLHGGNGMRTIIDDYTRKDSTRFWLNAILLVSIIFTLALGTYVIFTFDATMACDLLGDAGPDVELCTELGIPVPAGQ